MANERLTEDLVDDQLRKHGFYEDGDRVVVEKQQSTVASIRAALAKASKSGRGNVGYPEFIITAPDTPDMVVVIECKADTKQHESADRNRPVDYAVDGVLHYARHLSPNYTVIAIAVSGKPGAYKWSNFLVPKGENEARDLVAPTGAKVTDLESMEDLIRAASFDPLVQSRRTADLISFSQEMHIFMRDEAELEEKEKPLVVAGTLLALRDEVFAKTYDAYPARELPAFWMKSIKDEVKRAEIPVPKIETMTQPFTSIEVHPELRKATKGYPKGLLNEIVSQLAEHVLPFLTIYHDFDVVGQFYGEFLKYTGGDGKGLGIVLTPKHITELFALVANVTKDDVVLDTCAGTGGFLIAAMTKMTSTATNQTEIDDIKRARLIGVEQQATMYALAASNMILRGDGKANLYQGSSFDAAITAAIDKHKPTVGLINPPYAKSKADLHELRFVEQMMDRLEKGGRGFAIVPVSCATLHSIHKENLLKKHTLDAVMSMPPELFTPVGAITCIMAFTAGTPHATSNRKTWFGYWRDDGFVKVKNSGRIDRNGSWPTIRDRWVSLYRNREVHPGESVTRHVTSEDEWVAEAYIETDYSGLDQGDLQRVLREHALHVLKSSRPAAAKLDIGNPQKWPEFLIGDLFEVKKGRRLTKANRTTGSTPFIGATEKNNGVTDTTSAAPIFDPHCLTVAYNGNSVGYAFYQDEPFFASDDVNVLIPVDDVSRLALLFVASVIHYGRDRFSYGYKWNKERMENSRIKLPATKAGEPDWSYMEKAMLALPFSDVITGSE